MYVFAMRITPLRVVTQNCHSFGELRLLRYPKL